ncbi:metalloregulator ArsR/SmtB family transcription factor [soil metagenome]
MTSNLDRVLAALAEPTRRHVVDLLRDGPRRAGELARCAETSAPAMSRHLRVLRTGGLVEVVAVEGDARLRLYRLRQEPFARLDEWLPKFWDDQLASFKAHAERS